MAPKWDRLLFIDRDESFLFVLPGGRLIGQIGGQLAPDTAAQNRSIEHLRHDQIVHRYGPMANWTIF